MVFIAKSLPWDTTAVMPKPLSVKSSSEKLAFKEPMPLEKVAAAVDSKNVFAGDVGAAETMQMSQQSSAGQLPDFLKIVGVVIANPSYVIIENKQRAETVFVQKGQPQGDFVVDDIQAGFVKMKYQNHLLEVPLRQ